MINLPEKWMSKVLDTSTIQKEVKDNAEKVRKRRLGKAEELTSNASKIRQERESVVSMFSKVRETLRSLSVDTEAREALSKLFSDLENEYRSYEEQTDRLALRFSNTKIRIVAFGKKSQGKSSFIKKFTLLPSDIIQTKNYGDDKDKTGCSCIYYHKKNSLPENPEIKVIFRSPDEILQTVNQCLSGLAPAGLKIDGKTLFNNWDDLFRVLNNTEKKRITHDAITSLVQAGKSIDSFGAHREILKSFFDPKTDYSELLDAPNDFFDKERGKIIDKSELPAYNDMQHDGIRKYPIVSEIHIYVDLKRGDMFENIEICDTKGMSIEAGGSTWEEEIYKEIGNSDAAFSIQMSGGSNSGGGATKFYEDLNNEVARHSDMLKDMNLKHYILINPYDNGIATDAKTDASTIDTYGISQAIYVGALVENLSYGNLTLDMQKFVDFVIYDMIKTVVVNTNETDKNLLKDLDDSKDRIVGYYKKLSLQLNDIDKDLPEKALDWDDVLKKAILLQTTQLKKEIKDWAEKNKVGLPQRKNTSDQNSSSSQTTSSNSWIDDDDDTVESSEYNCIVGTDEDISTIEYNPSPDEISRGVYKMLTKEDLSKSENISNQDAVKKAIEKLFNKFIAKAGVKKGNYQTDLIGTSQNIGAFVDHLSILLFEEVNENINHCFIANTNNKNLSDFKNKLFGMIWNKLFLGYFCDQENFNIEKLETMLKDDSKKTLRTKKWVECYNSTRDNIAEGLYPRTSFSILKCYFEKVTEMPSENALADTTSPIFDLTKLKEAVVNAYEYHDYVTRYKQQINNDTKAKRSVLQITMADMATEHFVEELFDFYKTLKPSEYGKILLTCGLISDEEKSEFDNQERIKNFRNLKQQLISFKTSI